MTQRTAQERLTRLGIIGVVVLSLLFVAIALNLRRGTQPSPPKVELPQEPPDLVLLVTANRQGKLEVCGCPGKRAEDLAKVASLLMSVKGQMERRGAAVSIIEGGDFVGGEEVVGYLMRVYSILGYQCVALSPRDEKRLSVIRTNADGTPLLLPPQGTQLSTFPLKGKTLQALLVNLGQPPVKERKDFVSSAGRQVGGWERLIAQLRNLRQSSVVLVAVAYLNRNEATEVLPRLRGVVDVLLIDDNLSSGNAEAPLNALKAGEKINGVYVAALPQVRSAVLSLMFWQGQSDREPFRVEGQWLYASGQPDHPQVKQIVDEYYQKRQKQLEQEMQRLMKIATQREYLPPEFCGSCHQPQYEQWLTTGHAHAVETLEKQKRMDRSCLTCHSLEFRMRGVVTERKKRGVECVDCHAELQDPATAKMHGQRPSERPTTKIVNETVCLRCHDQQNSPNFNLQTYLPKVTH